MSEQQLPKQGQSNAQVIIFISVLSLVCATILSILASALKEPQEIAKELDRSKQMLIAAHIMNHEGNFLLPNEKGDDILAKYVSDGMLIPGTLKDYASQNDIIEIYKKRIIPILVDAQGKPTTFEKAQINLEAYIGQYRKTGYYKQPLKLIYEILDNPTKESSAQSSKTIGYIIPVNGYGLWDAIYGYLALKPDGDTVIGISWYDQKETPGLGANIAEASWQSHFPGKKIFQPGANGQTDYKTAPLGITVVKGKVSEVLGNSPKAKSSVDGMPGATLTGNGVTTAYRDILAAYRPFFMKIQQQSKEATR